MSKPQRRKGNVQSASSAHAAALLEKSGQPVGFVGFDTGFSNVFEAAAAAKSGSVGREIDSDVVLIFRKLSKKDPQTREKALRELIVSMKEKNVEMVELCCSHYAVMMDKLALDGSPTVRVLSLRAASLFISTLKKAAEKHLKAIMPFILFGTCDSSLSVANQAESVLSENFPGEKTQQASSIFAVATANIAIDIIAERHYLAQGQKYDCEDSPEQRLSRLTTQCLLTLARLAPLSSSNPRLAEVLEDFFKDTAIIKKLVKGNASVKSALLGVCLQMNDCVPLFLETPLANWVISSLDSPDSSVGTRAFEAFIRMGSDDRFFEKFNVQKSVIPKLLSVLRKKEVHWRHVYQFFLPSYALLIPRVNDQPKFIHSFLESFLDGLPFESSGSMQFWANSFAECLKYTFSKDELIAQCSETKLVELVIQSVEQISNGTPDCQKPVVELIQWILEKKVLSEANSLFLLDSLQLNLINKRPQSDGLGALLVASASWCLRAFHIALLRVPPLHADFVSPLLSCSDDYLSYVDKNVDIISLLKKETQVSSEYARVVLRVLRNSPSRFKNLDLSTANFTPFLLPELSPNDWPLVLESLGSELVPCLKKVILQWERTVDLNPAKNVLQNLEVQQRGAVLSAFLEQENFSTCFIAELMRSLELPEELTAEFSRLLFRAIFFYDVTDDELDSVLKTLSLFPPCEVLVRNILDTYLKESSDRKIPKRYSLVKLQRIGIICSQLLYEDRRYLAILPSQSDLLSLLVTFDSFIENDVTANHGLFSETPVDIHRMEVPSSEDELIDFMENIARKAVIYLTIDCEDKAHDTSLAFAAAVVPAVNLMCDTRWKCVPRSEVFTDCRQRWEEVFQKTALATYRAVSALVTLPSAPASAQLCLRILSESGAFPTCNRDKEWNVHWHWATSSNCSPLQLGPVDRWISRYHTETPLEFLTHVYEYIQTNASEWQETMFNANSLDSPSWRISVLCLRAATSIFEDISLISSLPPELLDFVMCGLVTALDSCDETMGAQIPNGSKLSALAGLALKMFARCAQTACGRFCNSLDTEWPNFFLPTMSRIIVRWFTLLSADDKPIFFVRSLVEALLFLKELPDDLSLKKKLCPELDKFGYDAMHQTLIIHSEDLIVSDSPFIRFAALHVLKLISPLMYRQENEQWAEEEKVSASGPRRLVVPDTLTRLIDDTSGWPAIMAFDAALVPLTNNISSDEERVAYCDVLLHPVSTVLPQILARCPEDIPSSKEREYFVSDKFPFSVNVFERYAANLLYRTLGCLPAVVRNWYAGLPNTGTQIVSRYVRYYVSKLLVEAELNKVKMANQSHLKADKSLKIRVVPVSGEVIAEYTVEETTMRLSIVMPVDWPLSVPAIQIDKAIVPSEKVKKWLLQLTAYLYHQNGSTVEGIIMWRKNVDRDVEGAEACTICMMTIHSTNHQLPKVRCRQCKNKFHSNCLYKWFESSSQSSCPLCRANFT
ncbi:hypothetical protein RB195_004104 [Necator americanus]